MVNSTQTSLQLSVRAALWLWLVCEALLLFLWFQQITFVILGLFIVPLVSIGLLSLLSGYCVNPKKLTLVQFLKLWLLEWGSFMLLFRGLQLLPSHWFHRNKSIKKHHVILVHGFFCNAGMWVPLAKKLERKGYSTSFVEMPSLFESIDVLADAIQSEAHRVSTSHPETKVWVVAFSMGGLAARKCLVESESSLFNLMTVHSPHKGTYLAWFFALLGAKNAKQMVPNSHWLMQLEGKGEAQVQPFTALWSQHDTIVIPAQLGDFGTFKLEESGKGHLYAALDPQCHRLIIDQIKNAERKS